MSVNTNSKLYSFWIMLVWLVSLFTVGSIMYVVGIDTHPGFTQIRTVKSEESKETQIVTVAPAIDELLQNINAVRADRNLGALTLDAGLTKAAQEKADDMVNRNYFEHVNPDGEHVWPLVTKNGYRYKQAGENLAASNQGIESVIQGWIKSPAHAQNLFGDFADVGLAFSYKGKYQTYDNTYFVVAIFAKK